MTSSDNLPLNELEKQLLDPSSECYLENLLDLVTSLVADCNYPSASNSRTVQAFLNRYKKASEVIEARRTKYADFEILKVIGQGGFGRVELCRHRRTRRVYAMKMMSKQHLLDHSQSGYWEERDVMVRASSEWLVACHHAFLDKENVYLCMEYMPGGDLYYWLEKYDTFNESQVRFYLAESILALEVLHSLRFIHRDLKPDNMLLDARGHLKLADFGSCVRVGDDGYHYCTSPIGTPDYISPEMLNCQSKPGKIGPECDWWSLGIIAFEMLFGEPAFYGQSLVETYSRILAHEKSFKIPEDGDPPSPELEHLIRALLRSAATRLGSLTVVYENDQSMLNDSNRAIAASTAQVKSHPFFQNVAWHQLRSQDPPIQPVVNSETDTSNINFDENEANSFSIGASKLPSTSGAFAPKRPPAPNYFTGNHLSFAGYTFNRDHIYLRGGLRGQEQLDTIPEANRASMSDTNRRLQALESEVAELRATIQTLEKQAAVDQVALKDSQRRLGESSSELNATKAHTLELEKTLSDLRSRCATIQAERDRLTKDIASTKTQLQHTTEICEAERRKVSALEEEKTRLATEIEQLHVSLQQTQVRLQEQLKQKEQVQGSVDPSRQREMISALELRVANLQAENREARQKATVLMTEASNLNRNHTKQVAELTDQLQEAQRFCNLYQSQVTELSESCSAIESREKTLKEELKSLRIQLDITLASKRTLTENLFSTESTLASTLVELRSAQDDLKAAREHTATEVERLQALANLRLAELNDVSGQLDEMRARCTKAEESSFDLSEQVSRLQKERELQQRNMKAIVDKLLHEVEGRRPPGGSKKHAKDHDHSACQQLAKNYKNLQSTSEKAKADLQRTIDQQKKDLAERSEMLTRLTEESLFKDQEISRLNALIHQLYSRLDEAPQTHSTPIKDMSAAGDIGDQVSGPGSRTMIDSQLDLDELYSKSLEQVVDLDSKGRGRKKLIWSPTYAVLKPFVLAFYVSRMEKETGVGPVEEIPLCRIIHVRKATSADLIHAQSTDIVRTLQFFFQKEENPATSLDSTESETNTSNANLRAAGGSGSNHHAGSDNLIRWLEHTFQPIRFRIGTVLCEVCYRPCSELRNPPPALECTKCRMRIHLDHVDQHQKFASCHSAAEMRYIRLPSVAEQEKWISHMNHLVRSLRELQQNPEKLIESGLSAKAALAGGVTQIGSRLGIEPLYRSIRAGSAGVSQQRSELKSPTQSSMKVKVKRRETPPKASF
ncbi:Rho-associated protein kinase 2 [Clonorchis sinensis]|uniref:non-specific serine/threonine protein kinase n=1 Tax=Clonorchis sinensis TaxID=79923 RepID=A0A8T1MS50_CLOSI|nr:Rho-associated protein kinase 2 [Clonorchis sinensis]